jgi:hypothetical protein
VVLAGRPLSNPHATRVDRKMLEASPPVPSHRIACEAPLLERPKSAQEGALEVFSIVGGDSEGGVDPSRCALQRATARRASWASSLPRSGRAPG